MKINFKKQKKNKLYQFMLCKFFLQVKNFQSELLLTKVVLFIVNESYYK